MDNALEQISILLYVIVAGFLGGIIGYERQEVSRHSGFRTHILVASASCLIIGIGSLLVKGFENTIPGQVVEADPIRLIEAITVGVSFIGGGIIIKDVDRFNIRNLTTAASILVAAAIGICVALNQIVLGFGATIFVVTVNRVFLNVEKNIKSKDD